MEKDLTKARTMVVKAEISAEKSHRKPSQSHHLHHLKPEKLTKKTCLLSLPRDILASLFVA
jgi:hypothetical protein